MWYGLMFQVRGGLSSESTWVRFQPKSMCLHLLHNQNFVIKLHIKRTYESHPVRQHYHYCSPLPPLPPPSSSSSSSSPPPPPPSPSPPPSSSSSSNYPAVSVPASSVNPLQTWIHLPLLRWTEAQNVKIYHDWLHCSQEISDIMVIFREQQEKQRCLFFPPNCFGIVKSNEKVYYKTGLRK